MACIYTGTITTEIIEANEGEIVVQFFTEDLDTSVQIPLTVPFLLDTDETEAEIQADIDNATLPGNVITLVSIDANGSVFSFNITRACPSANLQALLVAGEEGSAVGALTASCDCDTSGECVFTGQFTFPTIEPGSGTFFITIEGITTQIIFDTEQDESTLQARVFASVIDKNNDNVFIVSFDGDGLVLGVELIRPCPEQSITLTATVIVAGEFDITTQTPIDIQFVDQGPAIQFMQCHPLDTPLVVGQTYIAKIDVAVSDGAITFQMTYGNSLDTGVIPIVAPFNQTLQFAFVVQPGDENAQLCVDVNTVGDNNTATIDNFAIAEAIETELTLDLDADCDCDIPKKKKRKKGFLPVITCICIEPSYFANGIIPNTINNGNLTYYKMGINLRGYHCYTLYPNTDATMLMRYGTCMEIDRNGNITPMV